VAKRLGKELVVGHTSLRARLGLDIAEAPYTAQTSRNIVLLLTASLANGNVVVVGNSYTGSLLNLCSRNGQLSSRSRLHGR
jgi:hypothetical protein